MRKTSLIFISAVILFSLINIGLVKANGDFLVAVINSNRTPVNLANVFLYYPFNMTMFGQCGPTINGFAECKVIELSKNTDYYSEARYPNDSTYFGGTSFYTDANGDAKVTICPDDVIWNLCDVFPPTYSNINEPTSPSIYSPTATYNFNITWVDWVDGEPMTNYVNITILEFDGVNYTLTGTGDVYSKSFTGLSAGTYTYKWYANDTANNWASTDTFYFTIQPITCGLTTTGGSPIAFGSVDTGQTSSTQTLNILNNGNSPTTSFTVYGTDWSGTGHSMGVGQTSVYDTAWKTLTTSPITIYSGVINNGNTDQPQFTVSIPQGQALDTYSQTITFTGSC